MGFEDEYFYTVYSTGCLEDTWREDVLSLLRLCDKEFVPPLSERTGTFMMDFNSPVDNTIESYFNCIEGQRFILAVNKKNEVIGFLTYISNHEIEIDEEYYICDYITTVIVHPEWRGRSVSEQLYRVLYRRNQKYIITRTWSSNSTQLHIMPCVGFSKLKVIDDDRGTYIDTIYFIKENNKI